MNIWDILVLAAVAAAAAAAIRTWLGKSRHGGCSCGCGGCMKDCPSRQSGKTKTKG